MGIALDSIEADLLRDLVPIHSLPPQYFAQICARTDVREVAANTELFRPGELDGFLVYVLVGQVALIQNDRVVGIVESNTPKARFALDNHQPRRMGAKAVTQSVIARIDTALLDALLTWDQSADADFAAMAPHGAAEDWMTRILQLKLFQRLPADNVLAMLKRMEPVHLQPGEAVIKQGDEGDYFYLIQRGRCEVVRKSGANAPEIKLAELGDGDSFGEEALVANTPRNATVRMLTGGTLLRLTKKDFLSLVKQPLHKEVDYYHAEAIVTDGGAWMDVRLPDEYNNLHFSEAINVPLPALRMQVKRLPQNRRYVLCCDTGRRSAVASFILGQNGFETYVLAGGLSALPAGVFLTSSPDRNEVDWKSRTVITTGKPDDLKNLGRKPAPPAPAKAEPPKPAPPKPEPAKAAPKPAPPPAATPKPAHKPAAPATTPPAPAKPAAGKPATPPDPLTGLRAQAQALVDKARAQAESLLAEAEQARATAQVEAARLLEQAKSAVTKAQQIPQAPSYAAEAMRRMEDEIGQLKAQIADVTRRHAEASAEVRHLHEENARLLHELRRYEDGKDQESVARDIMHFADTSRHHSHRQLAAEDEAIRRKLRFRTIVLGGGLVIALAALAGMLYLYGGRIVAGLGIWLQTRLG